MSKIEFLRLEDLNLVVKFYSLNFVFFFDASKFELKVGQKVKTSQKESKFATKIRSSDPKNSIFDSLSFQNLNTRWDKN